MRTFFSGARLDLVAAISFIFATWLTGASARGADEVPPGVVATLKGHTETVYAVAFSPDGKYVLTGSFDKTLKLWETSTGKEIKTFGGPQGHQNLVLNVAFSPDGRTLASGASDNTAKLWDSPLSTPLRELAHADAVHGLALTPDGTKLASACKDGTVKVWNAADGKLLFNLTGHAGAVTGVSFNGNGQLLASSGIDKTVRFWNATNGQAAGILGAHATPVNAVALSPGNNVAYSAGDDGLLKFWQLPAAAPRALVPAHSDAVTAVALTSDGNQIVSASADKTVRISNFANGQQLHPLTGPAAAVQCIAVSPNNATIAGGLADGRLFLWSAGDGKVLSQAVVHNGAVTGVAINSGNNQVLTAGSDGILKLWAYPTPKKPGQAEDKPVKVLDGAHAGGVAAVVFHSNGTQALSGGADKTVKLWDLAGGKALRTHGPLADPVRAVAFSRDFTQIGAAAGKTVKVWNAADGKELHILTHPVDVSSISFSVDKTKLATGSVDNVVRIWDLGSGKELEFFAQGGPIRSVVFHNNNTTVVSGSSDKTVAINTLSATRMIPAATVPVRGLTLLPAGSHIFTASDDKTVKLWNLNNGANERTFIGAEAVVNAVALSKNGVLLAAGGADKAVRVYTFADAKQQGMFKAPASIRSLAFSPNNQTLAAACEDRSLVTWNVLYTPAQPVPQDFGKPGQAFAHTAAAMDVVFATDSVTLYSASVDKTVKTWKVASDLPTKNFAHGNLVDAVAFNSAGALLATGSHDGTVRIWDLAKGAVLKQIAAHTMPAVAPVYCVAWSPDGKQVLSGSFDHSLKLWDATSGSLVREFKGYKEKESEKGHREGVFCAAFSVDGKFIASGSSDRTIKIWNVADGTVVRELVNPTLKLVAIAGAAVPPAPPHAHPGWVYSLRFTADGKLLVSAGNAPRNHGYLAVWNAADGKLLHGDELPLGAFYSVAVSPDSKFIVLGCGPRSRQSQEANSYVIKMPDLDKRQAAQPKAN